MFNNLPDNVNHSDFDEPESSQYIDHICEQLPEWLKDFADDKIGDIIVDDMKDGISEEGTIERIKELPANGMEDKYANNFAYLVANYASDYFSDRWLVKYNKHIDGLELRLRHTSDGDYLSVVIYCFKDINGNETDTVQGWIYGKKDSIRYRDGFEIEPELTFDLERDTPTLIRSINFDNYIEFYNKIGGMNYVR